MTLLTNELQTNWSALSPLLLIRNEEELDNAINHLNQLLDEIGDDEEHPLYGLLDTLGTLIEAYEEEHYPISEVSGLEALQYLMQEHHLTQSDLAEIGSQGVVSEILNGKRELNIRQIRALAKRFNVSAAVFV